MNDNILKIRTLVDRFFDGETTLDDEQLLYTFFRRPPSELPEDLAPLRELFLDLAAVQHVAMVSRQTEHRRWPRWAAAAAAVLVLVVTGATALYTHGIEADGDCVAYIYGERTTDPTVVLSEMQKTMSTLAATDGNDIVEEQLKSMFSH